MGVGSNQPLAESKGVRCEAESEGSSRQSPEPRNTNCIRHIQLDKIAIQIEIQKLPGSWSVNTAVTWDERELVYHGIPDRHAETEYEAWLTIAVRSQQRP